MAAPERAAKSIKRSSSASLACRPVAMPFAPPSASLCTLQFSILTLHFSDCNSDQSPLAARPSYASSTARHGSHTMSDLISDQDQIGALAEEYLAAHRQGLKPS